MINFLYKMTRKGWLKALSFILATAMFVLIILNSATFAHHFGGTIPYLAILVFYGMAILWIHGIGFEIRTALFRMIFMPIVGYLIIIPSIFYLVLAK
ncbi:cyd operon protein YbgE [Vespertiliibacter pulmonis]|uniref:Cyd operon protein YbgE n=1 Tax=Vespertiliibacter pulmonis TaxID=1443036 RepID=A0A3N4W827_9PAST|nr:cyd operon protein YbgE [Vespertiliibacter pulmonis]QLB21280.1 cyd operon protein YbgE [Vespertiliibacter pulmonis]RPE85687.1 cyd operon protein YbgE [Vespertiliibacter pulmonis]